jgi:hypothetical protein
MLDQKTPELEEASNSANEWLSLMLYDIVWMSQFSSGSAGSSRHTLHWARVYVYNGPMINLH